MSWNDEGQIRTWLDDLSIEVPHFSTSISLTCSLVASEKETRGMMLECWKTVMTSMRPADPSSVSFAVWTSDALRCPPFFSGLRLPLFSPQPHVSLQANTLQTTRQHPQGSSRPGTPSGQTQSTLYRLQWLSHGLIPYKYLPTHDQLDSPDDEDLAAGDLEWYYPRQTITRDGYLVITLTLPSLSNLI